jgi:hypothetical protein
MARPQVVDGGDDLQIWRVAVKGFCEHGNEPSSFIKGEEFLN